MSFFKQVENLKKSIIQQRNAATEGTLEHQGFSNQLDSVNAIVSYIKGGSWATDKARERVLYAIMHGYSEAAEHYGTSSESIKASIFQASEKLKSIFGYPKIDILQLISSNMLAEATYIRQLRTSEASVISLFAKELHDDLFFDGEVRKVGRKKFLSCIKMLKELTLRTQEIRLIKADEVTLESIMSLLTTTDADKLGTQVILYSYLVGEYDRLEVTAEEELMRRLESKTHFKEDKGQ
jgi:hypothetical protein